MERRDTKQIIIDEALELFATNGYDGVTVADIAAAVGIKAASLYKHYKSKQDIFDSIFVKAADGYKEMTDRLGIDGHVFENDVELFAAMGTDMLIQGGTALFQYFLHDETTRKLRRMLTIEQYKNPSVSKLLVAQYIDGPLDYQSAVFRAFIGLGTMKNADVHIAAMHFYAPIYLMLCLCDACPEREPEALELIKQHILQFNKLYMLGEAT